MFAIMGGREVRTVIKREINKLSCCIFLFLLFSDKPFPIETASSSNGSLLITLCFFSSSCFSGKRCRNPENRRREARPTLPQLGASQLRVAPVLMTLAAGVASGSGVSSLLSRSVVGVARREVLATLSQRVVRVIGTSVSLLLREL